MASSSSLTEDLILEISKRLDADDIKNACLAGDVFNGVIKKGSAELMLNYFTPSFDTDENWKFIYRCAEKTPARLPCVIRDRRSDPYVAVLLAIHQRK